MQDGQYKMVQNFFIEWDVICLGNRVDKVMNDMLQQNKIIIDYLLICQT